MKHLGDITKIHGDKIPVVDVIAGGSPCQDLSVAGKRAGLAGERSGLFMDQMRIVKEMRDADKKRGRAGEFIRPRYMVWENVPGAFTSNGGKDFQAVLSEIVKVADPNAPDVPLPKDGKWTKSGCLYDELGNWSIAWRVHDAQFWGVPQRRKRIALVADFGGLSAPEICFERKGLSGDFEQSGAQGQSFAGTTGERVKSAEPILLESNQNHATVQTDGISTSLPASAGQGGGYVPMITDASGLSAISFQERAGKPGGGKGILIQGDKTGALQTNNSQSVMQILNDQGGSRMTISEDVTSTLRSEEHGHQPIIALEGNGSRKSHRGDGYKETETMFTLNSTEHHAVAYGISSYDSNGMKSSNPHSGIYEADTSRTLDNNGGLPACNQGGIAVVQSAGFDAYQHHAYRENEAVGPLTTGSNSTVRGDTPLVVSEAEVFDARGNGDGKIAPTVTEDHNNRVTDFSAIALTGGEVSGSLVSSAYKEPGNTQDNLCVVTESYQEKTGPLCASGYSKLGTQEAASDMYVTQTFANEAYDKWSEEECGASLRAAGGCYGGGSESLVRQAVVRRLTPLECERLQGFPDNWTDIGDWTDSKGKKHKAADSPRYKALGNSIALPFWFYLLRRIAAQYERPATLGSLFDGIGGFPLCWERCNGKGTALWASEIEEFPIAVTKIRFSED